MYQEIADELILTEGVSPGKWFGLACLKANGYIFAAEWTNGDMLFKLTGDDHATALSLEGSMLFRPMGNRKPMKEWVQVPPEHAERWPELARAALGYIRTLPPKK